VWIQPEITVVNYCQQSARERGKRSTQGEDRLTERHEIAFVLKIEYFLFVEGGAFVARALLLWNEHVRDRKDTAIHAFKVSTYLPSFPYMGPEG
jgi:hypothetical protein